MAFTGDQRHTAGKFVTHAAIFGGEHWRDTVWILLLWMVPALILWPFQNTPFIDDWTYAWSVERLLTNGDLRVLDWSAHLNPVQVLWGTLFCLPFGFSFTALRVSTWVCGGLSLWGTYLLLREFQVDRRDALIGVATLGAYPVFFILSYTFMTDVPFLTAMIWSILAFVWAVRHRSDRWLWAAVAFACFATGIRITGMVLPVAMILVLMFHTQRWGISRGRFLYPIVVIAFFGLLLWWQKGHTEHIPDLSAVINVRDQKLQMAIMGLRYLPSMLVLDVMFTAGALGLALFPLAMGAVERYRYLQAIGIFLLLWGGIWITQLIHKPYFPPLSSESIWAVGELGETEPLVPDRQLFEQPPWLVWTITAVTLASASVLLARLLRRRWQQGEEFL